MVQEEYRLRALRPAIPMSESSCLSPEVNCVLTSWSCAIGLSILLDRYGMAYSGSVAPPCTSGGKQAKDSIRFLKKVPERNSGETVSKSNAFHNRFPGRQITP